MKIIEKGNSISSGTWYKVDINGHQLNILSKVFLPSGKTVLVQRKDHLTLKIIKKNSKDMDPETIKKEQEIHFKANSGEKPNQIRLIWPPVSDIQFSDYMQIWFMGKKAENLRYENLPKNIFFSFDVPGKNSSFSGIFIPKNSGDGWDLFYHSEVHIDQIIISELLGDLPIAQIKPTTKLHIDSLRTGLNISV